ncbi:helix-turn-helix domain-containing protein [Actinacidiphila rubida]|uniref:Regulatory protein, luxR family n=1 Tax=Actinacidiphila rubida TaxID=310780 RepID=A0A1H8EH95_9ACTN|nr:helix-turn-helix transcriptional regulator [Actinacidiphila rubida]SEN18842.1 regulatory protein, luxR family [Actinacidiphila rubida]
MQLGDTHETHDPLPRADLPPWLADDEVALYGWAAVHEHLDLRAAARDLDVEPDRLAASLAALGERGLLRVLPGEPPRMQVVDPDLAAEAVIMPFEETIRRQQAVLRVLRDHVAGLRQHYVEGLRARTPGAELIPRLDQVRVALNRASAQCRSEIMTSQPGGNRDPEALAEALVRDTATLARGVRMRTLYHHTARFNAPSQAYVAQASALGAEYRTAHELFGRLIVFDREMAFLPDTSGDWGAVVVREPNVVHFLCELFEQVWTLAQPFSNAAADGLEMISREIDGKIVKMLAAGLKDETIARRLGISLRTARRHIADIMQSLGAGSRFQAGVLMASRGLLTEDRPVLAD